MLIQKARQLSVKDYHYFSLLFDRGLSINRKTKASLSQLAQIGKNNKQVNPLRLHEQM